MPNDTAPAPARRTQAERRAATQRALLDATLACLSETGVAATTTTAVCARAGVSQGALFRYFPTKADLLAAALRELFERLYGVFEEGLADAADADLPMEQRCRVALDVLYAIHVRPDTLAAIELYVASRVDPDLAVPMREVELAHNERILDLAAATFPEAAQRPVFRPAIRAIADAMAGIALRVAAGADPDLVEQERAFLVDVARPLLDC